MTKKQREDKELPDKEGATPGGGVKNRRLNTLADLRRMLADVLNRANSGELPESKARCLGYLASVMASVIKDTDFEQRISRVEAAMKRELEPLPDDAFLG